SCSLLLPANGPIFAELSLISLSEIAEPLLSSWVFGPNAASVCVRTFRPAPRLRPTAVTVAASGPPFKASNRCEEYSSQRGGFVSIDPMGLFLELRRCFIQGILHRRPCRIHSSLHVLPRRFACRAHFLQLLVR